METRHKNYEMDYANDEPSFRTAWSMPLAHNHRNKQKWTRIRIGIVSTHTHTQTHTLLHTFRQILVLDFNNRPLHCFYVTNNVNLKITIYYKENTAEGNTEIIPK